MLVVEPITVNHVGRIAHGQKPNPRILGGVLWGRDIRFYFSHVQPGQYTLEVQMKETQRMDAGSSGEEMPKVDIFIDNRLAAEHVTVQTEQPDDLYLNVPVPVTVSRCGFTVRIFGVSGGLNLPCLLGMRLLQDGDVLHTFAVGDAAERAMWAPSEVDMEAGTTVCRRYEEHLNSGVPLGGIGTGRLELLTNGTLGSFSLCNNWDIPTNWTEGSFFALRYEQVGESRAMLLCPERHAGGYDLPTVKAIHYRGRFPVAELGYELPEDAPIQLSMRAQGTMTPGNAQLSALPGALFTFTVNNRSDTPVEIDLLASLENLSGQGGYSYIKHDWSESYRVRYTSVEGACQQPWAVDHLSGLHFSTTRTPVDNREENTFTDFVLAAEGDGVSHCISWAVDEPTPAFWSAFAETGILQVGNADSVGQDDAYRPAGAVARKVTLAAGETREVVFVLAWYHRAHYTFRDGANRGHAYQQAYPTIDAVAAALVAQREEMATVIDRFHGMLTDSTLPGWLRTKLINSAFPVTTNSVWTNDDFFSIHESPTEMCGAVGTIDQRMAAHPFTFAFFPMLDRLELDWFRRCQADDGQIPHMIGNVYDQLGTNGTFFGITNWPDLSCSFIFQTYRHFLYTGDLAYLERNFPAYERALSWINSTDNLGLGLPIGGCTYDYEQDEWKLGAPMIFNAVCYLGALRTAMDAARRLGRKERMAEWQQAFDHAHETLLTHYWNGRYFRKWVQPNAGIENPNCFIAQLAGDWFIRLLGLEPLFSNEVTDSVLNSIVKLNMAPHYPAITMESSPTGELVTPLGYIQQHEPYLGMELIYRGQVQRGLEVLRRRQEISWLVNANPWGEALATQTPSGHEALLFDYMTAPAGWNVLYALAGITVDAQNGRLHCAPQLDGARRLRLPIFLQDLWLVLDLNLDRPQPARLDVVYSGPAAVHFHEISIRLPDRLITLPR